MNTDEQAIRQLIQTWIEASANQDIDQMLPLMSDDIVFLTPGQKPFGKQVFAAAARASARKVRLEPQSR